MNFFTNFANSMKNVKTGTWKNSLKGGWQAFGMKAIAVRPEIMLAVGCISLLAGTVYACTKTEEAKKVLLEAKNESQKIDATLKLPEDEGITVMPETKKQLKIERGRQYSRVYIHTAYEMMKLYGIPALLWFGGMGLVIGGHVELKTLNKHLAADILAGNKLLQEYRGRVAKAVGEETEKKIYLGAQEGMVKVLEKDPESGEEKIVEKKADIFVDQPGSIFALNFTNETSDAFDIRAFAEYYLEARVDRINKDLELGIARAYNAFAIYRMLGFNENAFGDNDEVLKRMNEYGISGNARKVPDASMRKLTVTKLEGYQERWDADANCKIYVPCMRLDFNFYPLEGKI